ncbi:MAG: ATP synthase F1 subunit gamma [Tidjanibacter sp.]|nr:ATP synthase F1 subunit gamma [Tidjanibacter sp.]
MASLKEIKERINSVSSTRKITSAMKMVSAAKLHKSQAAIVGMGPYSRSLSQVMEGLLAGATIDFPLTARREVERVAIVALSSDSSLCGAFNTNVARQLAERVAVYDELPREAVEVYTIGKKINEAATKAGYNVVENFEGLAAKPDYDVMAALAQRFMDRFVEGTLDKVEVVYHRFKSAGSQVLTSAELLPLVLPQGEESGLGADYILEPSREELLSTLLPKSVKLQLYTALLDSSASEHAARVIAMQMATENADELLGELTVEYNKSRQQAITNELLDIVGGSMN